MSNACSSGLSSDALPSAALIPPSAAPEWLRTGWIFETMRHVGAHVERLDCGAHAGAAGADDQHVVLRVHDFGRYTNALALGSATSAARQAPCSLLPRRLAIQLTVSGNRRQIPLDLANQLLGATRGRRTPPAPSSIRRRAPELRLTAVMRR